jgi:hypothetical protein
MWLPGMKVRDEKGHPVGLLAFQLFGVRFLIVNIKSPACGGFLCDDMGLGKTIQGLAVGQILHNHSQLSYLLMEAIPNPDGTRTNKRSIMHLCGEQWSVASATHTHLSITFIEGVSDRLNARQCV